MIRTESEILEQMSGNLDNMDEFSMDNFNVDEFDLDLDLEILDFLGFDEF